MQILHMAILNGYLPIIGYLSLLPCSDPHAVIICRQPITGTEMQPSQRINDQLPTRLQTGRKNLARAGMSQLVPLQL